jgi:hypothetical protein
LYVGCVTFPRMSPMKRDQVFPLRVNQEDRDLVAAIQEKTTTIEASTVWRQALRVYAKSLKIKLKPDGKP